MVWWWNHWNKTWRFLC